MTTNVESTANEHTKNYLKEVYTNGFHIKTAIYQKNSLLTVFQTNSRKRFFFLTTKDPIYAANHYKKMEI